MDLGVRHIRTAGKGSGSIELTLPAELRDLVGLPCRIVLRDGSRPDIVLQPDLQRALIAFAALWQAMARGLLRDGVASAGGEETPKFPVAAFGFGLQPRSGASDRPFLCWRDGLVLAGPAPHDPAAVSRTLAAFGHALSGPLHIAPALAAGFGAACGYLVCGVPAHADGQEACDLAAAALQSRFAVNSHDALHESVGHESAHESARHDGTPGDATSDAFWRYAGPLLAAAAELFVGWSADPAAHATLRAAWRRGRSIEMSGG
jgi:hypothetical protein